MSSDLKVSLTGAAPNSGGTSLTRHDLEDLPTPLHQRKFADAFFCILFVVFWGGMLVLAGEAFARTGGVNGYLRLTNGVQFDGQICGVDLPKRDYLYWPNPAKDPDFGVCVTRCPVVTSGPVVAVTDTMSPPPEWQPYNTVAVYHYCMPSSSGANSTAVENFISHSAFGRMVADLRKAWPVLIGGSVIAVATGFLYLSMLWYFGPWLIYLTILVTVAALAFGGYALLDYSSQVTRGAQHDGLVAAGVVVWVMDIAFILVVCCMRKSLSVALTCLKQATVAINDMKRILLLPIAKFGFLFTTMVWFTVVAVFIVSSGTFESGSIHVPGYDINVPYKRVQWTSSLRYSLLYHTFGTVWTLAFILAAADVIIAGAIAHWYFTRPVNGVRNVDRPIRRSIGITFHKQVGAIAFGSLVLTLVWFVKWFLRYLHKRLKNSGEGGKLLRFLVCCCMCCVSCFECCLKFLERQAYIEMAIFGGGFCSSAKRAYHLITRNALRLVAVNFLGSVFSVLGVVLVIAASCISSYFLTVSAYKGPDGVSSPILIVVVVFMISFVIGSVFMQVLDMSIQTILHCFVADVEAHDGQPQYLPHSSEFSRAVQKRGSQRDAEHAPLA